MGWQRQEAKTTADRSKIAEGGESGPSAETPTPPPTPESGLAVAHTAHRQSGGTRPFPRSQEDQAKELGLKSVLSAEL